jgi:hypothetical protein
VNKFAWFRHNVDSRSDAKIMQMCDKYGAAGYAYFYMLIEMYCRKYMIDKKQKQKIHLREISNIYMTRVDKTKKIIETMSELSLIVHQFHETVVELDIPNFLKYYGKISKKTPDRNKKNREEEEEVKKKTKVQKQVSVVREKFNWLELQELWNTEAKKSGLPKIDVMTDIRKRKVKKAVSVKPKEIETQIFFKKVFSIAATKGFTKSDGSEFVPNFDYVFRNENYIKFFEEQEVEKFDYNLEMAKLFKIGPYADAE